MRDRHAVARRAAHLARDAEKHRIENLAVQLGSSALRRGDVEGAVNHLRTLAPQYERILHQEHLDTLADV